MIRLSSSSLARLIASVLALAACRDDAAPPTSAATSGQGGDDGDGGRSPGTGGGGAGAPGGPIKVLNWNVRNMFDTKKDSTDEGEDVPTQAQYDFKMDKVVTVLQAAAPQVVVLAEIENQSVLDDLATRIGPQYIARELIEGNDPRGIDVAVVSTIAFDQVVSHKDERFAVEGTTAPTFNFTRDCPEFHMTIGGRHVVFLAIHLRSKLGDEGADKRLAEGQRARAIANGLLAADPNAAVILLGDFNDVPGSPPIEAVRAPEPAFLSATDFVPEADRWTFNFQGNRELIDHQLSNPNAAALLDQASVVIDRSPPAQSASDHSPLSAVYVVP